ncbi:MAG: glycosyltransferase family 2 protein, partial [Candidatus Omnitrophota bacterium]|nr:glycosyltransferase family 2 protein [Candidatus Omnitrophota bacterium]
MVSASVIIPTYNGEKTIRDCLNYVLAQDFADKEVIVIDSSTDSTPQIIKKEFPAVRLYQFDERKSCGEAKNIGVNKSKGEYIFFLDDDKIVDKGWISSVLEIFDKQNDIEGLCGSIEIYSEATTIEKIDHLLHYYNWLPCRKRLENATHLLGGTSVYK